MPAPNGEIGNCKSLTEKNGFYCVKTKNKNTFTYA